MSELSVVDWFITLLGSGPGAALYAQPLSDGHTITLDFCRPNPAVLDVPSNHVTVQLGAADDLLAPMNGMLWKMPGFPWSDELKAHWPRLTVLDTDELGMAPDDLLLEVWPAAFRRMEQIFASLEIPPFDTAEHPPSRPAARWFVVRGVPGAAVDPALAAIVDQQFGSTNVPTLERFNAGEVPIYIGAGDLLASLAAGAIVELRAFDKTGQVIDPVGVLETFARLSADLNFQDLARPSAAEAKKWSPPAAPRHVLLFTNHRGKYYRPWTDFDDPDGDTPEPLLHLGDDTLTFDPIPYAIQFIEGTLATTYADSDPLLSLDGEHERLGLHPDGIMKRTIRLPLAQYSFARIQVNDWREWFPHRQWGPITPGENLARYSEGNEVVPLPNGIDTGRFLYRAIRATYRNETYADDRDIPVGAPFPAPPEVVPQVLLSNAWTSADFFMTGRRSMLTTPRLQPGASAPDDLLDSLRLIPVADSFPSELGPPPGTGEVHYDWWLVTPEGTLAPGAWVELQQLEETYDFVGDDPRHPEMDRASDLFGTLAAPEGRVGAFVGASGQLALPVTLAASFTHRARLRVVVWDRERGDDGSEAPPTRGAGRGQPHLRTYPGGGDSDGFDLPVPPSGPEPAPFSSPLAEVSALRLDWEGVPGQATLVVPAGTLQAAASIAVLDARTGEVVVTSAAGPNVGVDLRIALTNVARRDVFLVAFLPPGATDLTGATHVFQVAASTALQVDGTAPVHPLELGGLLREAIGEGIDVRVLAWRDNSQTFANQLRLSVGMVHLVNATGPAGLRGQAISDPTGREVLPVHHQKGAFIRTAHDGVMAFLGGMDTKLGRWDTAEHLSVQPERPHTTWHDVHCRVRGRAAWDVYRNFQQRWNVARARPEIIVDAGLTPLPPTSPIDVADTALTFTGGTHAVQINRTIAPQIDEYAGFVDPDKGDLSARESYRRAIERARHFLYIEEQYLWDRDLAKRIRARLVADDLKFVILVLPRFLSELPVADLVLYAVRLRSLQRILFGKEKLTDPPGDTGGDLSARVLVVNPRNDADEPTYVHCKTTIADDLWMSIGSANMSRRSMTYDSELNAAAIDTVIRRGGRQSVRQLRTALMAEHLGLLESERPLVEDPDQAFDFMRQALDDEIPWLIDRRRSERHDLVHTHYGFQTTQEEQAAADALVFALDSDGELTEHGIRFIDVMAHLRSNDREDLGALGALEITFDVTALGLPAATLRITVEVQDAGLGDASKYAVGPFPGDASPRVPVLAVNREYLVSAKAVAAAAPAVLVGQVTNMSVTPAPYVTPLTLVLTVPMS